MGFAATSVAELIRKSGGIRPGPPCRSPRQLSLEDREEISRGVAAGESIRCIAPRLEPCAIDDQPRDQPQRRAAPVPGAAR